MHIGLQDRQMWAKEAEHWRYPVLVSGYGCLLEVSTIVASEALHSHAERGNEDAA